MIERAEYVSVGVRLASTIAILRMALLEAQDGYAAMLTMQEPAANTASLKRVNPHVYNKERAHLCLLMVSRSASRFT